MCESAVLVQCAMWSTDDEVQERGADLYDVNDSQIGETQTSRKNKMQR